jgi:transitional endoplasmic reticulum ATPase
MATLLIILGVFLVVLAITGGMGRARRRRIEEEREAERIALEQAMRDDPGGGPGAGGMSPFAGMPFGSLFEQLMSGKGGFARSMSYDPRTGEWIDETHVPPQEPREPGDAREEPPRKRPQRRRSTQPQSPLAGLLGGMGGAGGMGGGGNFEVEPPEELGRFDQVGGMDALKQEVRDTVGLMLQHPDEAERYGIEWNGILLHGPPGVGKTFFARAIAGEYGLNLIHVSTGDLVSSLQGGSAQNIDKAFQAGLGNLPCLLFFDEFDSVAQRRDATPDQESRKTVNQLLTSLEAHRDERQLLVMAATNNIEQLDPAVVRPGRFDRHIRIDLPDAGARRAIFQAELDDRPAAQDIDLDELVRRTEGMTPASISKVVDAAALEVFREAAGSGRQVHVDTEHLVGAIERLGGQDRPLVEHWNWESLILPQEIKAQLQQLQSIVEDPESARRFGIDPPTGLLLAGPPGTGKTTVAKVLAAQARASFYPVSGADVMSKWVGESEGNIRRLFERARANRPSIVFIDEIDAIAGRRGSVEVHDSHVNQLLSEIDGVAGQKGVFIVGATNRPDQLDPALLRGGRLSRTVMLGLPDEAGRLALLKLYTARMPTVAVRLEEIAAATEGMSPADIKALCQEAALAAMTRGSEASVSHDDFTDAVDLMRSGRAAQTTSY